MTEPKVTSYPFHLAFRSLRPFISAKHSKYQKLGGIWTSGFWGCSNEPLESCCSLVHCALSAFLWHRANYKCMQYSHKYFISMDDVNINELHLFRMKHTKTVSQNDDQKNEVGLKCALSCLSLASLAFHRLLATAVAHTSGRHFREAITPEKSYGKIISRHSPTLLPLCRCYADT